MVTVGYGDFYTSTFEGRFLCIGAGIIGICMNSMLIVSLINLAYFEGNERNVFDLLERLELKDEHTSFSYKLINSYFKLYRNLKTGLNFDEKVRDQLRERFLLCLLNYENNYREMDNSYPSISNYELLNTEFDLLEDKLYACNEINGDTLRKELDRVMDSGF